jgi:hypothetical protein
MTDKKIAHLHPGTKPASMPLIPAGDESALGRARDQIAAALTPHLIRACELLSEEIATIADAGDGGDNHNVIDALLSIWRVRWEIGALAAETNSAESPTGGAR